MSIIHMNEPTDLPPLSDGRRISKLMHLIWQMRPDLQTAFDLASCTGREGFAQWYVASALREYRIPPVIPKVGDGSRGPSRLFFRLSRLADKVRRYSSWLPVSVRRRGMRGWNYVAVRVDNLFPASDERANAGRVEGARGATLLGYANGILGMGEHVRMSAQALEGADVPFGVLNYSVGVKNREAKQSKRFPQLDRNKFRSNIFHINADQMLGAYTHLGPDFFDNRYNIGFWAWELSDWPAEWVGVFEMVDEVWAPSQFIKEAVERSTDKPVVWMPLCVELPDFPRLGRRHFALPEEGCLFLYTFDFMSYMERKNPYAAIEAFKRAFPDGKEQAGLVLKVMNGDPDDAKWRRMVDLIDGDRRIHVLNAVYPRPEVLALFECCDCFVSLHRSEGFGRGPAEAMYLGKPVIVTNYSGNTDFTLPDNSLLVDYKLIPVEEGDYHFARGQVWADVDVDHAASHMRTVYSDDLLAGKLAARGQAYIREHFSQAAIGRRMADRLGELGLL